MPKPVTGSPALSISRNRRLCAATGIVSHFLARLPIACRRRTLRGDLDDAVKEFHAALQLRADEPELHEALGELYLDHHSDDAAAQSEFEKALALDPLRTRSLYLLGRFYVQKKDNEKALPYLQRALRLQPDFMEANSLLGTVYVRLASLPKPSRNSLKPLLPITMATSTISSTSPIKNSAGPNSRKKNSRSRKISAVVIWNMTKP